MVAPKSTWRGGWLALVIVQLLLGGCSSDRGDRVRTDGGTRKDGSVSADGSAGGDGSTATDGSTPFDDSGGMADASSPDGGSDASQIEPDASDRCVPESVILATIGSGGFECSFTFNQSYTPGEINLLLTPGWGTVCYAGSPSNCGSGASTDGWWFDGNEITLCDRSCERFYEQTMAGRLTVQIGCPTENCMH